MSTPTLVKNDTKDFLYDIQGKKNLELPSVLKDRKNVLDLRIVVLLDVSGSISLEVYQSFMEQLNKIKGLSRVRVCEFSTEVSAMYDYFATDQSEVMRLTGGGGTLFAPAFEQAKKLKPDACIIFTDGDNFEEELNDPEIPTGLVLTEGGKHNYDWMKLLTTVPASQKKVTEEEEALKQDLDSDNDTLKDLEDEPDEEDENED
jgi:predicted metal-dependent peptidase